MDGPPVPAVLEPAPGQMLFRVREKELYLRAVRELARFHRRGAEERWPDQLRQLGAVQDQVERLPDEALLATRRRVEAGRYTVVDVPLLNRVEERLARVWPVVAAAVRAYPATLIHGDCHDGNLFVTDDGQITLIDWSPAATGPGLLDLAALVDVAERMGDALCRADEVAAVYFEAVGPGYGGNPALGWGHVRMVRALLELRWFAATGVEANRELRLLERYLGG